MKKLIIYALAIVLVFSFAVSCKKKPKEVPPPPPQTQEQPKVEKVEAARRPRAPADRGGALPPEIARPDQPREAPRDDLLRLRQGRRPRRRPGHAGRERRLAEEVQDGQDPRRRPLRRARHRGIQPRPRREAGQGRPGLPPVHRHRLRPDQDHLLRQEPAHQSGPRRERLADEPARPVPRHREVRLASRYASGPSCSPS